MIQASCSTSFSPGNRGYPVYSSARMQPRLHMSMAMLYGIPGEGGGQVVDRLPHVSAVIEGRHIICMCSCNIHSEHNICEHTIYTCILVGLHPYISHTHTLSPLTHTSSFTTHTCTHSHTHPHGSNPSNHMHTHHSPLTLHPSPHTTSYPHSPV